MAAFEHLHTVSMVISHGFIIYGTIWYGMVLYSTVQYNVWIDFMVYYCLVIFLFDLIVGHCIATINLQVYP